MYIFDSYALWRSLTIKQREEVKERLRLAGSEGQLAFVDRLEADVRRQQELPCLT